MLSTKLALVAMAVIVAALAADTSNGQARTPAAPVVDLHLQTEISWTAGRFWRFKVIVDNSPIPNHPAADARNVKVQITTTPDDRDHRISYDSAYGSPEGFDAARGLWTIPIVPAKGRAVLSFKTLTPFVPPELSGPFKVHAIVVDPEDIEPVGYQDNNEDEFWVALGIGADPIEGDTAVEVVASNPVAAVGEQATFTIAATYISFNPLQNRFIPFGLTGDVREQFDVRVRIELSPGLAFVDPEMRGGGGWWYRSPKLLMGRRTFVI